MQCFCARRKVDTRLQHIHHIKTNIIYNINKKMTLTKFRITKKGLTDLKVRALGFRSRGWGGDRRRGRRLGWLAQTPRRWRCPMLKVHNVTIRTRSRMGQIDSAHTATSILVQFVQLFRTARGLLWIILRIQFLIRFVQIQRFRW